MTKPPLTREELEQTVTHLSAQLQAVRLQQAEDTALLGALLDTLAGAGLVPLTDLERRRRRTRDRLTGELAADEHIELAPDSNKYEVGSPPDLDCAAILPICQGRCCRLTVCLTRQDLDEGLLAWNLDKPYQIRHRPTDKLCVYSEPGTGRCNVYPHRPAACRKFDCRNDPRIWKDFAARILAD